MGYPPIDRLRQAILLLLVPVALACSRTSHEAAGAPRPIDHNADVPLEIANHNWLDVTIYVVHDGQRSRVGVANASSWASFVLPARLIGQGREIRLFGDPVGAPGAVVTESFVVQPGQYVEWTLESGLERSSVGIY